MNVRTGIARSRRSPRTKRRRRSLNSYRRQQLGFESLEDRRLLSATDLPFQNPTQRFDVNFDLRVTALDALQVINFIGRNGSGFELPEFNEFGRYPDVNGSDSVSEVDALQIINGLVPNGPIVSARLLVDSGPQQTSNLDFITNQYDLEFGATYSDGSTPIELRINGADDDPFSTVGTAADLETLGLSESEIDTIAGSPLADGAHRFEVRIGSGGSIHEFTVTIDRQAPAASFDLDTDSDTDPDGDQLTEQNPVSLVGSTEALASVELVETGATVRADESGDFRFEDVTLSIGQNILTARVSDVAGNSDDVSRTIILGDLTPPAISAALVNDSGTSATDQITSEVSVAGSVVDSGTITELRASFGISLPADFLDVTSDLTADAFSLDRTRLDEINGQPLEQGFHTLRLVAKDDSENWSNVFELPFTLDSVLPVGNADLAALVAGPATSVDVEFDGPVDDSALESSAYSIVNTNAEVPLTATVDSIDRLSDSSVRLNFDNALDDGRSYELTIGAGIKDLAGNATVSFHQAFKLVESFRLSQVTPSGGEEMVSVTREAIIRFSEQVDPTTVDSDSILVTSLGNQVPGRLAVSSTGRFATFFPDSPWNPSTVVRLEVDGDAIKAADGDALDADGDGISGGMFQADFRTLPLTRIAGTNVFGFLRDSFSGDPIVGATIRVDAFPEASVVTDENGRFELQDMPAPDFFVHFDGSTATSAPAGTVYPNVGKPLHSIPGQTIQIESNLQPFDVFLPPMALTDIQSLSATDPTEVGFGNAGKANLAAMFPEVDPSVWDRTKVGFAPNAAVDEQGNPATEAAIIPVPPDRIPAPLPSFLDPELIISIQAGGATNFDVPAPVSFPNLDGLDPGEQVFLFSFNHDAGRWDVAGTATVSADGAMVESDPGVGVVAPGWHTVQRATQHTEEVEEPKPDVMDVLSSSGNLVRQLTSLALNGAAAFVSLTDTTAPAFGQFPFIDQVLNAISAGLGVAADIVDDGMISGTTIASVDLALIGMLNPDPISGTVIDGVGLGLTLDSFGQNSVAVAQAGRQLLDLLEDVADWEVGLTELSDQSQAHAANLVLLADGVEDIRTVHDATGQQPTDDPDLVAQYLLGLDKLEQATAYFGEQPGGNISGAYTKIREGYQTFLRQFDEVFDDRLDPAAGRPYDIALEDGTPLARGVTDLAGNINVIIPPNERIVIRVALPLNGGVMTRVVGTGPSGTSSSGQTFLFPTDGDDTDGDGLFDEVEEVLGTSIGEADSDTDVINDRAEIEQGLNPLDGRAFPTGIISSIPLLGESQAVFITEGQAYVAGGSLGISILDVSQFNNPIVIGQFTLPGDSTDVVADASRGIAAVASNLGGLQIVDVSDPVRPTLLHQIDIAANQLELRDGVVYASVVDSLVSIDLLTGEIVNTVSLAGNPITDIAREGRMLYTMDTAARLRAIETSGFEITPKGSLPMPEGGGQLFVGNGIAYVAAVNTYERGGFGRADVSDPDNLTLISGSEIVVPNFAPGTSIVANGSGLGILAGSALELNLMNLVDLNHPSPSSNDAVVGQFVLPEAPQSVDIASGLAYVASGSSGLQVVNYRPFDTLGIAPTIEANVLAEDADLVADGIQVPQGTTVPVEVIADDDIQVRKVELLFNGQVVRSDVSFPWDLAAPAVNDGSDQMTVQTRAIDTGGNEILSDPVVFDIIPDVDPPTIVSVSPANATTFQQGLRAVRIRFSESMAADTLSAMTIRLLDGDGNVFSPVDLRLREDESFVQLTYAPLPAGNFQIVIDGNEVTDRAGVPLGGGEIIHQFTLTEPVGGSSLFPAAVYYAGAAPNQFAAGDLDFDGDQDIAVIDASGDSIQILENNGDGTFMPPVAYADTAVPSSPVTQVDIAIADIDDNGDLDVVLLSSKRAGVSQTASINFYPGNGDGTVGELVTFDAGFNPTRLLLGDFNNDDVPDAFVLSASSHHVVINDGTGNFAAPMLLPRNISFLPSGGALGDVNGDDHLDIVVSSRDFSGAQSLSLYLGNGDGTFADRTDFSGGTASADTIALADLNDDTHLDIAIATNRDMVSVVLGNGDGTFGAAVDYSFANTPTAISIGDFNNDSIPDLITTIEQDDSVQYAPGVGDGTFGDAITIANVPDPDFMIVGQFNRDTSLDIVTNSKTISSLVPLLGNGDGTSTNSVVPELDFRTTDAVLADLNDDDLLDMVGRTNNGVEVRLANPDGTFSLPANLGFARDFTIGDVDNDNDQDVILSNTTFTGARPRTISVFLNDGAGILSPLTPMPVRAGDGQLRLGLMDGDDILDLVFSSFNTPLTRPNHIVIHPGIGDGTFGAEQALYLGDNKSTRRFQLADVNNDSELDVVAITENNNVVAVLEGNGDGTLGNRTDITIGTFNLVDIELADLNDDGNEDLVLIGASPFVTGDFGAATVMLGNGDGTFGAQVHFQAGVGTNSIAIADIDDDGILDLIVTNSLFFNRPGSISVLIGVGDGTFAPEQSFLAGERPQQVAVGDLNGDDVLDVLVSNFNTVALLFGNDPD